MSGAVASGVPPQRSVRRDTIWALAYTTAIRIGTLGISVAVARLGGVQAAGAFGIALQVTALGSVLATFNLPQSLTRHLAQSDDPARRRTLLRTSAWLVLGLSLAVGTLLVLLARPIGAHLYRDDRLAPIIASAGALTLATAGWMWLEGALQGLGRFDRLARWGAALSLVDLVVGVGVATFGVVAVVLGRALARAGALLVALLRWGRNLTARRLPATADAPAIDEAGAAVTLLGFAGPALLSGAVVLAGQTVLRMLLVRSSGLAAAGHYQAADSLAQGLGLLPGAASIAFMRAVASVPATRGDDLQTMLRRAFERMAGAHLPLCLVLIAVVRWVPELVFGRAFAPTRPVLVLLAAANGLMGPAALFGAALLGRGEVWAGVAVNLLWGVVVLGVFSFATSSLGAPGAAWAILAGYAALLAACLAIVTPGWSIAVATLMPTLLASAGAIALSLALTLSAAVPTLLSSAVSLILAWLLFHRWGLPVVRPYLASRRWTAGRS